MGDTVSDLQKTKAQLIEELEVARQQIKQFRIEARQREAEISKTGKIGLWDWDLKTNKVDFSDEWKRQIGYEPSEIGNDFREFESRVHPDDIEPIMGHVRDCIDEMRQDFQVEFRFRHKDGSYRWILDQASTISNESGAAVGLRGSHIDITERKRIESELFTQNELSKNIANTSPIGITVVDIDGQINYANPTAESILKLETSELLDRTYNDPHWKIFNLDGGPFPDDQLPFVRVMKTGEPVFDVQHGIETPDGQRILLSINAAPLKDPTGKISGMVAVMSDITERIRMEESLRSSEEKYRLFTESTNDWVWQVDARGAYTYVSPSIESLIGYSPQEVIGKTPFDFMASEEARRVGAIFQQIASKQERITDLEDTLISKDGQEVVFETNAVPVFDEAGTYSGYFGTCSNITERKRVEEARKQSELRFKLAFDQSFQFNMLIDPNGMVADANELCFEVTQTPRSQVIGKEFALAPWWDFDSGAEETSRESVERALKGETVSDEVGFFDFNNNLRHGRRIYKPIFDENGKVIYVNVNGQDTTDQRKAEQSLAERERSFHGLFNTIASCVAVYEPIENGRDFVFVDINPAGEKHSKVVRDEIIGKRVTEVFPGIKDISLFEIFQEVYRTGKTRHLPLRTYKDNRIREWVENTVYRLPNGQIVAVYEDTSEQRLAEEALQESEKRLIASQYIARMGDVMWEVETGKVSWSPGMQTLMGYSEGEILDYAKVNAEVHHPDDLERIQVWLEENVASGKNRLTPNEYRIVRKDGVVIHVHVEGTIAREEGQPTRILATVQDISERIKAEKLIQEYQRELELTVDATTDGIWKWNFITNELSFSPKYYTMLGYEPDEFPSDFENWKALIHPDDLDRALSAASEYLETKPDTYENEFRLRTKSGEYRWIRASARVVERTPEGEAVRMIGNHQDITDHIKSEERNRSLAEMVDFAPNSITIHDSEGNFVYANRRTFELHGYTPEAFFNLKLQQLDVPESAEKIEARIREAQEIGEATFEVGHYRRDGSIVPLEVSIKPIEWQGKQGVLSIARDITERKQAEDELRKSEARHRDLARKYELLLQQSRSVIQTTMDGFWLMDAEGGCLEVNQAFADMLGYSKIELLSMNVSDIDIDEDPEDMARHAEEIKKAGSSRFEARHRRKDGRIIDVEISTTYLPDQQKFTVFARDITERKRKDLELKETNERLQAFLDNAADAIYISDKKGTIIQVNAQASRDSGYSRDELLSMNITDIDAETVSKDALDAIFRELFETRRMSHDSNHKRKDGTTYPVEITISVLDTHEGERVIGIARDMTERRRFEQKLKVAYQRISLAKESAKLGIWDLDLIENHLEWDERMFELYGLLPSGFGGAYEAWLQGVHPDDVERASREVEDAIRTGENFESEFRVVWPDETVKYIKAYAAVVKEEKGQSVRMIGVNFDITDQKLSQKAIVESEKKYRLLADNISDVIWIRDLDLNLTYISPSIKKQSGFSVEEKLNQPLQESMTPESVALSLDRLQQYLESERAGELDPSTAITIELDIYRSDGTTYPVESTVSFLRDDQGEAIGIIGVNREITDRKEAENALQESEERFRSLHNASFGGIAIHDKGRILECNQGMSEMTGYSLDELIGMDGLLLIAESKRELVMEKIMTGYEKPYEAIGLRKNGEEYPLRLEARNIPYRGKQVRTVEFRDITDSRQAEEALRASEERLAYALTATADGLWDWNIVTGEVYFSPRYFTMLGYEPGELPSTFDTWQSLLNPDDADNAQSVVQQHIESQRESFGVEFRLKTKNGEWKWILGRGKVVERDKEDKPIRMVGTHTDISELKLAEQSLKSNLEEQSAILESSMVGIMVLHNRIITKVNSRMAEMLGYSVEEMEGKGPEQLHLSKKHFEEFGEKYYWRLGETNIVQVEYPLRHKDGHTVWCQFNGRAIAPPDLSLGAVWIIDDITERKAAEEEKSRLQEQLQQSQKMESVGRLAGGVAHDFNNLLTGITGNVSLAMMDLSPGDPLLESLGEIGQAADSAASLTRQLLAFSRKQIIKPKVLDLNQLIDNMQKMLRRLIGEDLELSTIPTRDLGRIKADPGQLEQILVNLAVNARDAMPNGGKLTIETANVTYKDVKCELCSEIRKGEYVLLTISDNGVGMDEDIRKKMFDPFFTTKKEGEGTGLGLAMVYGIVLQHEGHIEVQSKPGEGTTFHISFPTVMEEAETLTRKTTMDDLPSGSETVLLVEDERMVRNIATKILVRQGYKVHSSDSGPMALSKVKKENLEIDLLVTDIVMPGMNGRELAEELQSIIPNLKVLYTSGYTEDVIAHHGVLDEGLSFIGKPYTPQDLAKMVRKVLDG